MCKDFRIVESENNLETPCFIINKKDFETNIKDFKYALNSEFKKNILSYSVKTNSFPFLLFLAKTKGCYAEVVSYGEYELAKKIGFNINNIVSNHVIFGLYW